jgi:hypothetical protein
VARVREDLLGRPFLDQLARVEHADALAHLPDHAKVVADEEHRGRVAHLQLRDQVENLCLDGRVEPGRGLVEDEEVRIGG